MIPREIIGRLSQLRQRERTIRLVRGIACFVSAVASVVLFGCLIDLLWDRSAETPTQVRAGLLCLTAIVTALGFLVWVLAPQFDKLPDDDLALMVEDKHPKFRNRLISAVQLNRPGAVKQGMSEELISVMTKEAETQSQGVSFASVTDHGRIGNALKFLAPVALVCVLLLLWQPSLGGILLARHFMADVDIPRNTKLEAIVPESGLVYPAGETVTLQFKASGTGFDKDTVGTVYATPEGQPTDPYKLKASENKNEPDVYEAKISPSTLDVSYTATLGDGRTKKPGLVKFVQRPVVIEQLAYTVLPEFCGLTPKTKMRYEVVQPRGDVAGILGSDVKIMAKVQKPIRSAVIEVLAPDKAASKSADDDKKEIEKVVRTVSCDLFDEDSKDPKKKKNMILCQFPLREDETGYRIVTTDEYGFKNEPPPRRNLRVVPEEAPSVVLLKDYFIKDDYFLKNKDKLDLKASLEDFHVDGLPVPVGGSLRVPYLAEGPYGLGRTVLLYRVMKKAESGNEVGEEEPWVRLDLTEVKPKEVTGPFDPRRGVFLNTSDGKAVDFYAEESNDPTRLGRTLGGGRAHLKTGGLVNKKGPYVPQQGDKIEYCIEVFADKTGKMPNRPSARSDTKVAVFGTIGDLATTIQLIAAEERKLREIEAMQNKNFRQ